jgi:hypothetical protein
MGNLCCAREYLVQFFVHFFAQFNLEFIGLLTYKGKGKGHTVTGHQGGVEV